MQPSERTFAQNRNPASEHLRNSPHPPRDHFASFDSPVPCSLIHFPLTSNAPPRRSIMILPVTNSRLLAPFAIVLSLLCATIPALAQKKPQQLEKPLAGPRATALRITILYVAPDPASQKVDRVQIGREMVVAEKNGPWLRVYANTDIEELRSKDAPMFGANETPPPVSGWMESKGIVVENTPSGDQI